MGGKISSLLSPAEPVYFHGLCFLSSLIAVMSYGSLQFFPWAVAHIIGSNKKQEVECGKRWDPCWVRVIEVTASHFALLLISQGIHRERMKRMENFWKQIEQLAHVCSLSLCLI